MEDSEEKAVPGGRAGEARMRGKLPGTQCTLKPASPLHSFPCSPFDQKVPVTQKIGATPFLPDAAKGLSSPCGGYKLRTSAQRCELPQFP